MALNMKELLLELRAKNDKITDEMRRGKISSMQADAQRRQLGVDIKQRKTELWQEKAKAIEKSRALIKTKHDKIRDTFKPTTEAAAVMANYEDRIESRKLAIMSDDEINQQLNDMAQNPENYAMFPIAADRIIAEAKKRPAKKNGPNLPAQADMTMAQMQAQNYGSEHLNDASWKVLDVEEQFLKTDSRPDEITFRHEGELCRYDIDRELEYVATTQELLGLEKRKFTSMDKRAGLMPEPLQNIILGLGNSEQEANDAMNAMGESLASNS